MQMGRHWRAAGVQFAVKVGELPASIFQEEPAPEREQSAGKVHKEHGNHDQDRRFVLQDASGRESGIEGKLPQGIETVRVLADFKQTGCWRQRAVHVSFCVSVRRQESKSFGNRVFSAPFCVSGSEAGEKLLSLT
jgi:hypothetical protein